MPFSEATKLEAKRKAHFACVICHQPFVEVHHILPQEHGGNDDIDNAAPLCGSCHDLFGGNPEKRKQIRQMRDFWYELCENRYQNSPSLQLNQGIDDIKTRQLKHGELLAGIQSMLGKFYSDQISRIQNATTASQVSAVSGVYFPANSPMYGEFVKLVRTGEIVKNEGFSYTTQRMTIKKEDGTVADVGWNEVRRMTGNEEVDFLQKSNQWSGSGAFASTEGIRVAKGGDFPPEQLQPPEPLEI